MGHILAMMDQLSKKNYTLEGISFCAFEQTTPRAMRRLQMQQENEHGADEQRGIRARRSAALAAADAASAMR